MDRESLRAAGWDCIKPGGFTGHVGALWRRETDAGQEVGLLVEEHHANNHIGTVHGGVIMTFADNALGMGVSRALGASNCATVSMQTQFVASARIGDFLICCPEVVRRSRQLVFMRGLVCEGDKTVASAEGIWKVLENR